MRKRSNTVSLDTALLATLSGRVQIPCLKRRPEARAQTIRVPLSEILFLEVLQELKERISLAELVERLAAKVAVTSWGIEWRMMKTPKMPLPRRMQAAERCADLLYPDPPCLREVPFDEKDVLHSEMPDPDRHRENIVLAADLLSRMNDTERKIFLMMAEEIQTPEIARRLGMKEPTVRVHIHRARQKISRQV